MPNRIVVDPITRIEGHLRIEAETNEAGQITSAFSSGTMVRGIETILKDRDPREAWAFAQRICGVCTLVHGLASVRSVEDALRYEIPQNANLIRNLMVAAQHVHDHVMHFYHLHALDWVDVVSALQADPAATSALAQQVSPHWPKSSPGYFSDVKRKLQTFVESGQLGIFSNGFWGHPEYRLPPEANLMATAHYLEALAWQRDVVKIHTIFGGKNPHPNFAVGGVPAPISTNVGEHSSATAVNMPRLMDIRSIIQKMQTFVDQVYVPDTVAIAGFYKDWFRRGEGVGNFMTVGDFPATSMFDPESYFIPGGVVRNRDLSRPPEPVDFKDPEQVQEFISHAWYEYADGDDAGLHPWDGETKFDYQRKGGPTPPFEHLNTDAGYSWLKSPRWRGIPVEVGPLARLAVQIASGHEPTIDIATSVLRQLELPTEAIFSTLGRTAARTLEAKVFADQMMGWLDQLMDNVKAGNLDVHNDQYWDPSTWPAHAQGVGVMEAPRGALGHWIVIKDGKIDNYQAVVPSTWNAGPRDANGGVGAYEAALADRHTLHDASQPLEIQRTVHSFDPCLACAVHVLDEEGEEQVKIRVR